MAYAGEVARLAAQYRDLGRTEAAAHRPPTDALNPDQHEVELRATANGHTNDEQRVFETEVTEAAKAAAEIRRRKSDLESQVEQLLNDNSLESVVQVKMADHRAALSQVVEDRIKAEVQYRNFRAANNITVEPHYPDSHVWHFAIIGLCFLFETTANAFFFSNAQGLLAGYGIAMAIAAVNIVSAMLLGMGFRYKNVAASDKQALGWLCLIVFIALSVYLNALFASYRSAYQFLADPADPKLLGTAFVSASGEALRIFVLDMRIADLTSFLLFGFGLLLSGLAFWKGYTFDDKYPEHGRMHRLLAAARNVETAKYATVRDEVSDLSLQYRMKLNAALNEPGELQTRANSRHATLTVAKTALSHDLNAIQNDYSLVLDAYRQSNAAIRGTPPPAYFTTVDPLVIGDPTAAATPKLEELKLVQQEAGALREKIHPRLNAKIEETNKLATKLLTDSFEAFKLDVEKVAQDNISRSTPTITRTAA